MDLRLFCVNRLIYYPSGHFLKNTINVCFWTMPLEFGSTFDSAMYENNNSVNK